MKCVNVFQIHSIDSAENFFESGHKRNLRISGRRLLGHFESSHRIGHALVKQVIKWKALNVITDNVIIRILPSVSPICCKACFFDREGSFDNVVIRLL